MLDLITVMQMVISMAMGAFSFMVVLIVRKITGSWGTTVIIIAVIVSLLFAVVVEIRLTELKWEVIDLNRELLHFE